MAERTTQEIRSYAQAALRGSPIYDLRGLRVDQDHETCLLISGTVDSYYHKQLAQELVRAIASDVIVVNLIHVEDRSEQESADTPPDRLRRLRGANHSPDRMRAPK